MESSELLIQVREWLNQDEFNSADWSDEDIAEASTIALNVINNANPKDPQTYRLQTIPAGWNNMFLQGTVSACLGMKAMEAEPACDNDTIRCRFLAKAYGDEFKEMAKRARAIRPTSAST